MREVGSSPLRPLGCCRHSALCSPSGLAGLDGPAPPLPDSQSQDWQLAGCGWSDSLEAS